MRKWKKEDSEELYNINGWGNNYFHINDKGNVFVTPTPGGKDIDLKEILDDLYLRDVSTPVLLRFPFILRDRIATITNCFNNAAEEYKFEGSSAIVYPIKVNQMKPVVEEIYRHGKDFNIGLEAGSKPELHAVLATTDDPESMIICNGYKDEDYITLALLAKKMGKKVFIVVEKISELKLTIKISKQLKVEPNIGIRIKLASSGSGKWESSGGDKSKFGLSSGELIEALEMLEENGQKDALKLIHFHLGSQINKIRRIKHALQEASQFYVQLYKMGFEVEYVDIGGGLGVDYDGTRSSSQNSINYSIQEYVNDAVFNLVDASNKNNIPHPNLITESGRSITAHHSILIFDVLEVTTVPYLDEEYKISDNDSPLIKELHQIYSNMANSRMLEDWHDAQQIREESLDRFSLGLVDLKTRAITERLFWSIARTVYQKAQSLKHIPEELNQLPKMLSAKYFCNFSLFQSLPDTWAIDQIFPIMPLQRLNEKPNIQATLQDISCDSDGKIDQFIGIGENSNSLDVHKIRKDERYYIGVFLVGAYQEILGDLHNLFGDTNVVHISANENGYNIDQIIDGERVSDVLGYVQYDAKKLVRKIETWVSESVKLKNITAAEGKEFLATYRSGLYGYTYLG